MCGEYKQVIGNSMTTVQTTNGLTLTNNLIQMPTHKTHFNFFQPTKPTQKNERAFLPTLYKTHRVNLSLKLLF
jgi:hypothetical protein